MKPVRVGLRICSSRLEMKGLPTSGGGFEVACSVRGLPHKVAARATVLTALLAVMLPAWCTVHGGQRGLPPVQTELQAEDGPGMAPQWAVQSAWVDQYYDSTRLYLRIENTTGRYAHDGFFYAEIFDRRRRFCLSALFRLRENRERERGPLRPGGERTLESFSSGLAIASVPEVIRVYPAGPRFQGTTDAITAPVAVRIPVTIWATSFPVPTPEWARLRPSGLPRQNDATGTDLVLAEVEVGSRPAARALGVRVLEARSQSVRDWVEHLVPHLRFDPAQDDSSPHAARALILVRVGPLRAWNGVEIPFVPSDSPWVRKYLSASQEKEILPVSVIALGPCIPDTLPATGLITRRAPRGCVQFYGEETGWSVNVRSPTHMP